MQKKKKVYFESLKGFTCLVFIVNLLLTLKNIVLIFKNWLIMSRDASFFCVSKSNTNQKLN